MSVVTSTFHPSFFGPIRLALGTRTSSKNTSLNSASPVICTSGRTLTPGAFISTTRQLMPRCLGASGSVRTNNWMKSARWAKLVHTF